MVPLSAEYEALATKVAGLLRAGGIETELGYSGSEKKRFEKAKKSGAARVLNVGPSETGLADLRLRNLAANEEADPVRGRLLTALAAGFAISEDGETRLVTVRETR